MVPFQLPHLITAVNDTFTQKGIERPMQSYQIPNYQRIIDIYEEIG
jgi:hypothetical protein